MRKNVLILSQDLELSKRIKYQIELPLTHFSYTDSHQDGFQWHSQHRYCLVILEMTLKDEKCLYTLRSFRAISNVPILILLADENPAQEDEDFLYAIGADDVLGSPPDWHALKLRMQALIRRYTELQGAEPNLYSLMMCDDLEIDPRTRLVFLKGHRLDLSTREFDFLYYLISNKGQVVNFDQIYERVWHDEQVDRVEHAIRTLVAHVRKKLGEKHSKYIENVRGIGYRYRPELFEF